ncbi:YafY family transcriptional regulator [Rhodococcus sp. BP-241]|uniref:helix-turn-helix transcriptional regulator n=1 Tax=unclassified Rhodococcus (in: high G+C Gram-positive bacteria) TaxID=192944 RepID=UPI0006FB6E9C|nr:MULTISPECIES: YafY family protein [unclassified Rhodococcus (in: high G+C Gram-positive bacteria)]KQU34535.1 protein pafC [Rhodococcus sp. Leaf225]KQU45296.1 protein pafC [Rhodococcus sp. Leaf258]MBY6705305.1 YafY family transcriptional regulator [Rhodococcus sp. BP-241]
MSVRLSSRLARLLNLVPYFIANPGISAADAAAELGVTTKQLMDDLNQLWMCGLPGYGPGDLIDLSFSEDSIEVTFSAGIDRPLRLTSTEATALLIALRSLVEMPGMVDPSAAYRAIAKIEAAAGVAAAEGPDDTPEPQESPSVTTVRGALARGRALHITYYSASRDVVSERTVDPLRIVLVDDQSYLQAWCRDAEGVRLFRLDRIDAATELDEPSAPPEQARTGGDALDLFHDDPSLPLARLVIAPDHVWILDYYPMTQTAAHDDGSIEVSMRFATLDWMSRLALGLGSGVRVLGPPALVREVTARSRDALDVYRAVSGA